MLIQFKAVHKPEAGGLPHPSQTHVRKSQSSKAISICTSERLATWQDLSRVRGCLEAAGRPGIPRSSRSGTCAPASPRSCKQATSSTAQVQQTGGRTIEATKPFGRELTAFVWYSFVVSLPYLKPRLDIFHKCACLWKI